MSIIKQSFVCFFLVVIIIVFAIIFTDTRAASPVELHLIKMFDNLPDDFRKFLKADSELWKNFYLNNYDSSGGEFPLKTLVSNGTITMKNEFKVSNFTSKPSFFNVGP